MSVKLLQKPVKTTVLITWRWPVQCRRLQCQQHSLSRQSWSSLWMVCQCQCLCRLPKAAARSHQTPLTRAVDVLLLRLYFCVDCRDVTYLCAADWTSVVCCNAAKYVIADALTSFRLRQTDRHRFQHVCQWHKPTGIWRCWVSWQCNGDTEYQTSASNTHATSCILPLNDCMHACISVYRKSDYYMTRSPLLTRRTALLKRHCKACRKLVSWPEVRMSTSGKLRQ